MWASPANASMTKPNSGRGSAIAPRASRSSTASRGFARNSLTGGGPRIELIEALEGSQTLSPWLKRYTKFYHMGYFAEDFDTAFEQVRSQRAVVLRAPVQSHVFRRRGSLSC